MRFGIELEFFSPLDNTSLRHELRKVGFVVQEGKAKNHTYKNWTLTEDESLNYDHRSERVPHDEYIDMLPHELVSPVLDTTNPEDIKAVRRIALALQTLGCRVNKTCGLHVHVDAAELSVQDVLNVFNRYTKFEPIIDSMLGTTRRANRSRFAKPCKGIKLDNTVTTFHELIDTLKFPRNTTSYTERYFKVNLLSLDELGTIEFRQHNGSINSQTIINWVLFLTQFVEASKQDNMVSEKRVELYTPEMKTLAKAINEVYQDSLFVEMWVGADRLAERLGWHPGKAKGMLASLAKYNTDIVGRYSPYDCGIVIRGKIATSKRTKVTDNLWRGISPALRSFYSERIQELAGDM